MSGWIALSDRPEPLRPQAPGSLLNDGTLIFEIAVPLNGPRVLLDYHREAGWPRGVSLFLDPQGGISLLHRQGAALVRHTIPGPLPLEPGIARLVFRWNAPARHWHLRFERPGSPDAAEASGRNPLPIPMDDIAALCAGHDTRQRHAALLWFGLTTGATLPARASWLGTRTPILTPTGYRPAGTLRPGDMVMTRDHGACPLRSARAMTLPSRGVYAPVLLRAPYFSPRHDLLVSADQRLLLEGAEIEYLMGEDSVLAEAQYLTDGRAALFDTRRSVTDCVALDMGHAALIESHGCAFASAQNDPRMAERTPPRRVLHRFETLPLVTQLGRGKSYRAA